MNFRLETDVCENDSKLIFRNIFFDSFKVNIVERYNIGFSNPKNKLEHALFKIRMLDDELVKSREGNSRIKIKGDKLKTYIELSRSINKKTWKKNEIEIEQDYVYFILNLVISNYNLN